MKVAIMNCMSLSGTRKIVHAMCVVTLLGVGAYAAWPILNRVTGVPSLRYNLTDKEIRKLERQAMAGDQESAEMIVRLYLTHPESVEQLEVARHLNEVGLQMRLPWANEYNRERIDRLLRKEAEYQESVTD